MWNPFKKKEIKQEIKVMPLCINCIHYSFDRFRNENHRCNRLRTRLKTINPVTGEEREIPSTSLECKEEREGKDRKKCGYYGKFFEDSKKYK